MFSWLFLICAVELVFLFLAVINEWVGSAFLSLGLSGLALHFLGGVDVLTFIKSNTANIFALLLLYFVIGLVWSLFKWRKLVVEFKETYLQAKKDILGSLESTDDEVVLDKIKSRLGYYNTVSIEDQNNKKKITNWIAFWPVSVLVYLLADLFVEIADKIYRSVKFVFNKITQVVLGKEFEEIQKLNKRR